MGVACKAWCMRFSEAQGANHQVKAIFLMYPLEARTMTWPYFEIHVFLGQYLQVVIFITVDTMSQDLNFPGSCWRALAQASILICALQPEHCYIIVLRISLILISKLSRLCSPLRALASLRASSATWPWRSPTPFFLGVYFKWMA